MSSVSSVSSNSYSSYAASASSASKTAQVKGSEQASSSSASASASSKSASGVIYEPSKEGQEAAAKAKTDRSALVAQLKQANEARIQQMTDLVHQMITGQGKTLGQTDSIWKFLADGDFTVDAQTKAQAEKDIAEDGYWGVEQTSQRIFDFAMALTGGDADKMEEMRGAFEKGFKQATGTWGKELPDISQRTYGAVQSLFDDYKNKMADTSTAAVE